VRVSFCFIIPRHMLSTRSSRWSIPLLRRVNRDGLRFFDFFGEGLGRWLAAGWLGETEGGGGDGGDGGKNWGGGAACEGRTRPGWVTGAAGAWFAVIPVRSCPHWGQKRAPGRFSFPHLGQIVIDDAISCSLKCKNRARGGQSSNWRVRRRVS
jgi:hypothetical protein